MGVRYRSAALVLSFSLLITVLMDGAEGSTNGPGLWLNIDAGPIWNELIVYRVLRWLFQHEGFTWSDTVFLCVRLSGRPHRSGQLCDQPVMWLPALPHRRWPRWRVCTSLRPENGPQWLVNTHIWHMWPLTPSPWFRPKERHQLWQGWFC